jgi:hypothetical protein
MITNPGTLLNYNKYLRYVAETVSSYLYGQYSNLKGSVNEFKGTSDLARGVGNLAEQIVTNYTGIPTNKRRMLEETLAMLVYMRDAAEKNLKRDRGRLPGQSNTSLSFSGGSKSVSEKLLDKALNAASSLAAGGLFSSGGARNRPEAVRVDESSSNEGNGNKGVIDKVKSALSTAKKATQQFFTPSLVPKKTVTQVFSENGRRTDKNYKIEREYFGNATRSVIEVAERFKVPGVLTTLSELADWDGKSISSLEEFKEILMKAPHITTPGKFSSTTLNGYKSQTLSSNSYWEVILEPFVHSHMNGGFSYLPSIREINVKNLKDHGIYTGYNEWLPIISFELERAKLTTKSLGLYEGEIVYPVGCEFLNELTITMINDSLKSWSGFWRTVMDVSTHNSEPHKADFYKEDSPTPTAIDYSAPMIALYKNITWRCKIYILSPQFSTIKKFDLLVVLKDYTESYSGDIDSPGGDVQLRFSIVGENPPADDGVLKPIVFTPEPEINSNTEVPTTEPTTEPETPDKDSGTPEEQPDKDKPSTTTETNKITTQTSTDPPKDKPSGSDGGSGNKSNKSKTPPGTGNVYYAVVDIPAYNPEDGDIHRFKIEKRRGNPDTDPYALNFQFNADGSIKSAYLDPSDSLNNDTYFNGSTYEELARTDTMDKLGYNSKNKQQNLAFMNWADYFYSPEYMDGKEDRTDEREEQERKETRDNLYEISHRQHKPNTYYRN